MPPQIRFPLTSALVPLPSRAVLHLSGPDAAKYLQGAITASIPQSPSSSSGFYAAFLTATGRVRNDVFVHPDPATEGFYIDVDTGSATALAAVIKRYRLRARFDVRVCEGSAVWQAWGDGRGGILDEVARAAASDPAIRVIDDTRSPHLGKRILTLTSSSVEGLSTSTPTAFQIRRILAGVPEGAAEIIPDAALPLEYNMDLMGGIDFHKGCYVGQELTIRTKHRGVVRKRVLPCVVYESSQTDASLQDSSQDSLQTLRPTQLAYSPTPTPPIPGGASIGRASRRRSAGKWLGGVGNIGLALCRLENMTDLEMPGEVAAGGYDAAEEFVVEWGDKEEGKEGEAGGVGKEDLARAKVQAFVPGWMRECIPRGEWWGRL